MEIIQVVGPMHAADWSKIPWRENSTRKGNEVKVYLGGRGKMATCSSRLAMLACVLALMPCFSSGLIPLELRGEAGGTRLRLRGGRVNLMESEEGMRMLHTVHGCLEATLSADQRIREEGEAALRQV